MASLFVRADQSPDVGYLEFFYPGILVMIILFTSIFGTISVIEDRQSGFLQGVLVSPGSRISMVIGKISGVVSMTLLQSVLFLCLLPMTDIAATEIHWLTLLLAIILSSASLTAIGISMAWILPSAQAYHGVMSVLLLPLWIISGAMFPPAAGWVETVMWVNPMTYMVDAIRGAMTADATLGVAPGMWVAVAGLHWFSSLQWG